MTDEHPPATDLPFGPARPRLMLLAVTLVPTVLIVVDQRRRDVSGEVLDAVFRLHDQLVPLDEVTRQCLVDLVDTAAHQWQDPDQGIWEVRGGPRHFLYSKLMCWVALDRACHSPTTST